ncbi:MAG: SprT family zinc-dependent metalloprotease [Sphingomicrobium sp.]
MWSTARSEASLEAALPLPLVIRPMRTARRMRLRLDDASGVLKLTCPWRTSRRAALAWALDQRDWIAAQLAGIEPVIPFAPGAVFPLEGVEVRIVWDETEPRSPRLADGELRCGGPAQGLARRIALFLKKRALETMSAEVAEYSAAAGVTSRSIQVGDASSRWGSCNSEGRIRLSWRLILAPPEVRRYVVAHEVAHLRHLDHGAAFKALEAQLFGPGLASARGSLRRLGPGLRRVGRS